MKLKELLKTISHDTNVCICDDMGPHNDTCSLGKLPITSCISDLEREVECIYVDPSDTTLVIELVPYTEKELEELE